MRRPTHFPNSRVIRANHSACRRPNQIQKPSHLSRRRSGTGDCVLVPIFDTLLLIEFTTPAHAILRQGSHHIASRFAPTTWISLLHSRSGPARGEQSDQQYERKAHNSDVLKRNVVM